jgi:hypothetical protein
VITVAPARRSVFGALAAMIAAGAAPAFVSPARAASPPTGTFLDMTRRFRVANDRFNALDKACAASYGADDALREAADEANRLRFALHDEVFHHRPETLADVAVLSGHAIANLQSALDCDLPDALVSGGLERDMRDALAAFAGILAFVAPIAGVDVRDIGWNDMHVTHARVLAELEG